MSERRPPQSLVTAGIHVDAPAEGVTEVADANRRQVRVMAAKVAQALYKRQRRREKRSTKAAGRRWLRRTAKHELRGTYR